eukprot:401748-Hanusia_phi.AAC.2
MRILAALSDTVAIMQRASAAPGLERSFKNKLERASKKIVYFCSWINEVGTDVISLLQAQVLLVKERIEKDWKEEEAQSKVARNPQQGKKTVKIVELA